MSEFSSRRESVHSLAWDRLDQQSVWVALESGEPAFATLPSSAIPVYIGPANAESVINAFLPNI